ncbi:MAG: gliding motility-associated C-terminal domain-containing protein [Adhaeribacter sp.]
MRPILFFLAFFFSSSFLFANQPPGEVSLRFMQNKGQWPAPVLFSAGLPQGWLFAEKTALTYNFLEPGYFDLEDAGEGAPGPRHYRGQAFKVHFVGANPQTRVEGGGKEAGYFNYFLGQDPSRWAAGVPAYRQLRYQGLFLGIDLSFYTQGQHLKYDYILAPGGRVSDIRMRYEGVQHLSLRQGRLYIRTTVNEIVEEKPYAYQVVGGKQKEVTCVFTLQGREVGFKITGAYDPALPLVIDPALIFSTYSGASTQLSANCATGDAAGNTYVASHMLSTQYPVTTGAYQTTRKGSNVAVAKLNPQGTGQVFATFLGGTNLEYPLAMTVSPGNELVVLAHSTSSDFPVRPGSYDASHNGMQDYVVAKLSGDGKSLLGSTFLGGSNHESGTGLSDMPAGLALDAAGNIYVGGTSQSGDFPVLNGFQAAKGAGNDAVIAKLNASLTSLLWASYLGGNQRDYISDLEVSASGKLVVGGTSTAISGAANTFPTTAGVIQPKNLGNGDGFVAVLPADGKQVLAATFLGTILADQVQFVEVDHADKIYAAGFTMGSYPITAGTYGTANGQGGYFVHKLNMGLSQTEFSTHIGNNNLNGVNQSRVPTAFRVDNCQNIYFSGYALASAPVTPDALEKNRRSLYLFQLSDQGRTLHYATYLGANLTGTLNFHIHQANHSYISESGTLHQVECTTFADYPVTANAFSRKMASGNDAAVSKFQFTPAPGLFLKARLDTPPPSCGPYTVQFKNTSEHALSYSWNFNDGSPESAEANPSHTFRDPGTYKVRLIAANPAGCKVLDTTYVEVVVQRPPAPALQERTRYLCQPQITLDAGNPGYSYRWSTGEQSQTITVSQPGTYSVTTSLGDCQITETVTVAATLPPLQAPNIFTPNQDGSNETFVIKNIAPNTRLKVFNRWGQQVYQSDDYQNDWDGRQLAAGTYYYHVDSPGACAIRKGWLELIR